MLTNLYIFVCLGFYMKLCQRFIFKNNVEAEIDETLAIA